jgi:hypothetical protein
MSLDRNAAVPKKDKDSTVFCRGVSSSVHVMWLCYSLRHFKIAPRINPLIEFGELFRPRL